MMNRIEPYAAVIFDLDGVLVDSEPLHLKSVELMLAKRGIVLTPEQAAQQTGITIHNFMKKIVEEWGYPGPQPGEDWVAEKRALFREIAQAELQAVRGVDALLRRLHGKTRLGLASSSPRRYIDWSIERFRWQGLFDAICTIEDVSRPKPDPEMYELIVRRLGVEGQPVLVFEDSPVGIQSACSVGLHCCGVATSFESAHLSSIGSRWVIADFSDEETLTQILGDLLDGKSGTGC